MSNEEWTNYLTKELNLNANNSDRLLHDLNNLRGNEWLEEMKGLDDSIIRQFERRKV